jgi:hypothetical protein
MTQDEREQIKKRANELYPDKVTNYHSDIYFNNSYQRDLYIKGAEEWYEKGKLKPAEGDI